MADSIPLSNLLSDGESQDFVGRSEFMSLWTAQLASAPGAPGYLVVLNIFGASGSGKTRLLRQFGRCARESGSPTASLDSSEADPLSAMRQLASQFPRTRRFKQYADLDRKYERLRETLETATDAPPGLPSFLGRSVTKGLALAAREVVPGSNVALEVIGEGALIEQGGDVAQWVATKFKRKKAHYEFVQNPLPHLSRAFAEGVSSTASGTRRPVILIDNYDRLEASLDAWIRALFRGDYGDLPRTLLVAIAGQQPLPAIPWQPFRKHVSSRELGPFTEVEAKEFLTASGISPSELSAYMRDSGGNPLEMTLLVDHGAVPGRADGSPAERFLMGVSDTHSRKILLRGSLPRSFNRDVLNLVAGPVSDNDWDWVKRQRFVEVRQDGWHFHEIARRAMLREMHRESPSDFRDVQQRLSRHFGSVLHGVQFGSAVDLAPAGPQVNLVDFAYHLLCLDYAAHIVTALNAFAIALLTDSGFGSQVAQAVDQAESDMQEAHENWGPRLLVVADPKARIDISLAPLEDLLNRLASSETGVLTAELHEMAADWWHRLHHYAEASRHLDAAIALTGTPAQALGRARILRDAARFAEAVDQVDAVLPSIKGEARRLRGEFWTVRGQCVVELWGPAAAIDSFDRAILQLPGDPYARINRGLAYRRAAMYTEALVDFDAARKFGGETSARATLLAADTHARLGDVDTALRLGGKGVREAPADYVSWRTLVETLTRSFSSQEAFAHVMSARTEAFTAPERAARAAAVAELDLQFAIDEFESLAEEGDPRPDDWNQYGLFLERAGRLQEAHDAFRGATEPGSLVGPYNLAITATAAGLPSGPAEVAALEGLLTDPYQDYVQLLYARAGLAAMRQDTAAALTYLKEAASIDESAVEWALHDVAWRQLRSHPEFREICSVDDA